MTEQNIKGNLVWNKKGDSLTIYISEDITLSKGDKLYCYRGKKREDSYGRQLYFITTAAKDYSKFRNNAEQPTEGGAAEQPTTNEESKQELF